MAITAAGVGTFTLVGGTAYGLGDAAVNVVDAAGNGVLQLAGIGETQTSTSDSGSNSDAALTFGANATGQQCGSIALLLGVNNSQNDGTLTNEGGPCPNLATSTNDNTADANVAAGAASAANSSTLAGAQTSNNEVTSGVTANDNDVNNNASGVGDATVNLFAGSGSLVVQAVGGSTTQNATANSGGNSAFALAGGVNLTGQSGHAGAISVGVDNSQNDGTLSNKGGTAGNTATSTNIGKATAGITTGPASATNTSSKTITQTSNNKVTSGVTANNNNVNNNT